MKTDFTFDSESLSDNMVLAVILLATVYWVLGLDFELIFLQQV